MSVHFPHPIPTSWYAVAESADLAPRQVRALEYFGRQLVLFRTESGKAQVLDAYCPHLGAHLGIGGTVEGESLACPFHGWRFNKTGSCVDVPYAKRVPNGARARQYPTLERNGFVWAWYDPNNAEPSFDVPILEQVDSPDWEESARHTWRVATQIQEMGENGVDSAHFPTVHGSIAVPNADVTENGAHRRAIQYTEVNTSKGVTKNTIDVNTFGMGFGYTHFVSICETLSLNLMTPIDAESTEFSVVFLQRSDAKGRGVAQAICRDLVQQVGEDIPIWENKLYRENPVLCDGDGPIAAYRRWCMQFYTEAARAHDAA